MQDTIHSNICLFVDDTIMYLTVSKESDSQALQTDLSNLEQWGNEWLVSFNPDKCEVIILVTKKRKPIIFGHKLHGKILKSVATAKYLGVTISQDLSWATHINQITAKTNNTLKFIKRNVQTHSCKLKEITYKTYVRPLTEYAAPVWDPWQKKYIDQIEMI